MENKKKSIANESVIGRNDESSSMYFSFNSTEYEDKTLEGEELIIDLDDSNEHNCTTENVILTVKKAGEPDPQLRAIPKNISTNNYKMHSSTPTKYFSPRPLYKRRDVSLGVSLLPINGFEGSDNKENVNNSCESPSTKTINEMNIQFGNLKVSKENSNKKLLNKHNILDVVSEENILKETKCPITKITENKGQLTSDQIVGKPLKLTTLRKIFSNEPNLLKNRPSRISEKKSPKIVESPIISNASGTNNGKVLDKNETKREKGLYFENLPNSKDPSKLKMERRRTIYAAYTFPIRKSVSRKSIIMEDNTTIKRQPRLSVSKTTLNSPGIINKNIRRTIHKPLIKNDIHKNIGQSKLILNCPKKIHPINDNYKHGSTSISAGSLKSVPKQKPEQKNFQTNKNNESQCKYCDKKFAISKALDIHLLHNCLKIPAATKKKLFINEHSSNIRKPMSTLELSRKTSKAVSTLASSSISSNDSVSSNNGDQSKSMPPPTSTKVKKKIPHSGIYRTPTKLLICPSCRQNYSNVYDYSEHMSTHPQEETNN